jgi:hypothetical protein
MVRYTAVMVLALVGSALAVPIPQFLDGLAPVVAGVVAGLGLEPFAPAVDGTLVVLGSGLKAKRQLTDDMSPDVSGLLSGLGLGSLAPGIAGTLDTFGTDV